jgi:hypothetical protein
MMPGGSWKTGLFGWLIVIGDICKLIADIVQDQGVPTNLSGWLTFGIALATGVGLIMSKDFDKTNSKDPSPVAKAVPSEGVSVKPMLALLVMGFGLVGCASYVNLDNGKAMRTVVTELRSPFGTNAGFMQLQQCDAKQREGYNYEKLDLTNCQAHSAWIPINSQGQGGQILGGALTGLGFGLGSAFGGSSTSSSATGGGGGAGGAGGGGGGGGGFFGGGAGGGGGHP